MAKRKSSSKKCPKGTRRSKNGKTCGKKTSKKKKSLRDYILGRAKKNI